MNSPVSNNPQIKSYQFTPIGTGEITKKGVEGDKAIYQQKVSYNGRDYTLTVKMGANATDDQLQVAFANAREKTAAIAVACRLGKEDKDGKFGATSIKILSDNRVQVTGNTKTSIQNFTTLTNKILNKQAKIENKLKSLENQSSKGDMDPNAILKKQQWTAKYEQLTKGVKIFEKSSQENAVKKTVGDTKTEEETPPPVPERDDNFEELAEKKTEAVSTHPDSSQINSHPTREPKEVEKLIKEKKADLEKLHTKVSTYPSRDETNNKEITDTKAEITKINQELSDLRNELTKANEDKKAKLENEYAQGSPKPPSLTPPPSLNTPNSKFAEISDLTSQLSKLQQGISYVSDQINQLEAKNDQNSSNVTKNAITEENNKLSVLQNNYKETYAKLNALTNHTIQETQSDNVSQSEIDKLTKSLRSIDLGELIGDE